MRSLLPSIILLFFLIGCGSTSENTETAGQANEEPATGQQVEKESPDRRKKDFGKIEKVEVGMTGEQVTEIMGEPTRVETLNAKEESKTEDWYYGDNQKVRLVRNVVNRASYDIKGETETIKELLKAKNEGDTEREKELIEKLKNNDY